MPNPQSEPSRTALIEVILGSIADWVNKYRQKFNIDSSLGVCSPDEVMHIAKDLRLSTAELQELARKGPDAADLLLKMLVALKVDPEALEKADPYVMQDLQRLCTTCGAKKRCEHELARGTAGEHFREFCPNAFTLDALLSQKNRSSPQ
ncbi:MAG TPA: DUF6455 family protein [Pseudolabrys sp.]|nr:DUF6455 family protein [Pseudolabrys sp.]